MRKLIARLSEEDVKRALIGYFLQKNAPTKAPIIEFRTNGYTPEPGTRITVRIYEETE